MSRSTRASFYPDGEGRFSTSFGDLSSVQKGDYLLDTLRIGQWILPGFPFAQDTQLGDLCGVMGLGFDAHEHSASSTPVPTNIDSSHQSS